MDKIENAEMNPMQKHLMNYSELRERQKSNVLTRSEVPIEHAVSLPLPTLKWGEPAYAFFAAPALRSPDAPMQQSAPDRWWVLAAHGGRLMIYALSKAIPFPSSEIFEAVTLPKLSMTRDELRQSLKTMEDLLDALVPQFFAQEAGDEVMRQNLAAMMSELLPKPLQPQYRALVADFFAWLEK
jgi:hypothetical protein